MNIIRTTITTTIQRAALCAPVAALRTYGKALSRFTPPRRNLPSVNPTASHRNGDGLPEVPRMNLRTAANTRAPRNVAVLLTLLAIAFTCCWSPTASAQGPERHVTIPDVQLRSRLLQKLVRGGDSDTRILKSEMLSFTGKLDLSAAPTTPLEDRITDLTGLECATNVRDLRLNHHAISDLSPITDLWELQFLRVSDNNISDLSPIVRPRADQAQRREMRFLNVSDNNISEVPPLALPTLLTLQLSGNPIGENLGGIQNLPVLRQLELNDTGLRDLQLLAKRLAEMPNFRRLYVNNNQITDISPLSDLTLQFLYIHGNQIRDLSPLRNFRNLSNLRLFIYNNQIRDISPIVNLELHTLDLASSTRAKPNPLSYTSLYTHLPIFRENNPMLASWNLRFFVLLRVPTTLEIVGEQTVPFGESVGPLVVRVLDQDGKPFAGVPVVFSVTGGDGTIGKVVTATHDPAYDLRDDEEGKAMTIFTSGTALGQPTVVATVTHEDTTLEVTFNVLPRVLNAPTVVAHADPTALQVNWQAPVYPVENYEVRYQVEDSEAWTEAVQEGTEPSAALADLIPGTTYDVQVRAQTTVGPSPWSPSASVATSYVLLPTRELSPSPVAMDRLVFNELRNADGDTHDWLELRNISDADIALADWELSIVASTGDGPSQDRVIVDFPDATLPAGEVLLIVNTDPRQTDLASGINIATGVGKRGARHRYFVAADLRLPSSPYLLLLRSAVDKAGTPDAVEDVAGNYFRETGDFAYGDEGTQVWPLQDTARPLPVDTALLTAGEAWARVSTEARGYLAAAWGKSGHQAGLGYQQNAATAAASLGTPGYANAAIVAEAPSGRVSISELMLATKAGRRTVPQWIELYNNSTTEAVKLEGWRLEIEYLKGEGARRHRFDEVSLTPLTVLPNQTVLLATWRAETSGHFPEGKVYNLYFEHPNAFNQRERRNDVLNAAGFSVRLLDASGTLVDSVGNLDGVARTKDVPMWEVPAVTTEGARASLIRQYEDSAPLPGTAADSWKSAANVKLAVSTYYGWETDIGTPGYREGGPLPVVLSHFQSQRTDVGVVIRWTTESSVDNAGFNLLRSESLSGPFTKINPALIPGSGTTGESSAYLFTDRAAKPGVVYYYRLEEVSLSGVYQSIATTRVRGHVSASGKRITRWSELKSPSSP